MRNQPARKRKNYEAGFSLKNKKMNDDVYKLRRRVVNIIYDFKNYADLPRINVRITDNGKGKHKHVLGVGTMDDRVIIWIPDRTFKDEAVLRHVVAHEIGHAVYRLHHKKSCPVMKPVVDKPATERQIKNWFKRVS